MKKSNLRLSNELKNSKGPGRARKATVVSFFMLAIALITMFYLSKSNRPTETAKPPSNMDVLLVNLDESYPKTPEEIVKLFNRILTTLYNESLTEEELRSLITMERKLFSKELTDINTLENQISIAQIQIKSFKDLKLKLIDYKVEQSIPHDTEPNYCFVTAIQYINNNSSTNLSFDLKKEDNQWKILSWKGSSINGTTEESVG